MTESLWKMSRVAIDGTHHVLGKRPLYANRFLRVLSFHEPGLAAVCNEFSAWHINERGQPAYSHVFAKTFSFYENLAAVQNDDGWFHVTSDGLAAYTKTYEWCGNFQNGRSAVRAKDGYFHILPNGWDLYRQRFSYVGDFRERRAVVRLVDGMCAHINEDGTFAHPMRYYDLDVYHKGYACARDERGWVHINSDGMPLYERRFAELEPFYNEQSLAKTLDGDIVTIGANGLNTNIVLKKRTGKTQ